MYLEILTTYTFLELWELNNKSILQGGQLQKEHSKLTADSALTKLPEKIHVGFGFLVWGY